MNLLTNHLKKCQKASKRVIEIDIRISPSVISRKAAWLVGHFGRGKYFPCIVKTFIKFPSKELYTHYAEDEPEYETHQGDIANLWYGGQQWIHNNLLHKNKNRT